MESFHENLVFAKHFNFWYIRLGKKKQIIFLEIEIDKLTNSIENIISGEVFATLIVELKASEVKEIKKGERVFNWRNELKDETKKIYKLTTKSNPTIIHGLISLTDKGDHNFYEFD